ncbi:hypothetical protein M758_6G035800 [Ceratodon purpureus]|nr:hypothetical protein M758_6G035800 [Ceratodon purpureus]
MDGDRFPSVSAFGWHGLISFADLEGFVETRIPRLLQRFEVAPSSGIWRARQTSRLSIGFRLR